MKERLQQSRLARKLSRSPRRITTPLEAEFKRIERVASKQIKAAQNFQEVKALGASARNELLDVLMREYKDLTPDEIIEKAQLSRKMAEEMQQQYARSHNERDQRKSVLLITIAIRLEDKASKDLESP